jgi:hypothetical protein
LSTFPATSGWTGDRKRRELFALAASRSARSRATAARRGGRIHEQARARVPSGALSSSI